MSYSGDAAEQVVRLSLEGGEAAVRLAGTGAKELAVLLYAILKDEKKTRGKVRLTNMLRSGKELKVFAVKDENLRQFCKEAKKYGILYCVLKDKDATDGITDVMVRAEDAGKINRIFERFDFATVDMASVKSELERDRAEKTGDIVSMPEQEKEALLDELLSPAGEKEPQPPSPTEAPTAKSRPSGPTFEPREDLDRGISESARPSVRQELKEIREKQKQRTQAKGRELQHKAPAKKKSKKQKER